MNIESRDRQLLSAVIDFTLAQPHAELERFEAALLDWGNHWQALTPAYLPAADLLTDSLSSANAQTRDLLALFEQHRQRLLWEQSYRKADGLVSDAMLAAYAFAEIIGYNGPFVSQRIRCGIGIWGAEIDYPRHRHGAEEVYITLAGAALFKIGDSEERLCQAGDLVLVESQTAHGFRSLEQGLVVLYLWQAGDLREVSRFA